LPRRQSCARSVLAPSPSRPWCWRRPTVRSANNNWCAIYTKPENENCTFATMKQCQAQMCGLGGWCRPNPFPNTAFGTGWTWSKPPRQATTAAQEATASSQRLDRAPRETRPVAPHRAAAAGRAPAHGDARRQANQSDRAADRWSPAPAYRARARAVSAIRPARCVLADEVIE